MSSGNSDLLSTGEAETSCPDTEGAGAAAEAAVAGPATAAAYLIGGILVFCVGVGTGGTVSFAFGNSALALVLSRVDFLEICFLAKIGLGGSSVVGPEVGLAADADAEAVDTVRSFLSSFAGVLSAVAVTGGVVASVTSMADDESRLDRSSLCDMSCRYSSSSCRLRSSYSPSSKSKSSSCIRQPECQALASQTHRIGLDKVLDVLLNNLDLIRLQLPILEHTLHDLQFRIMPYPSLVQFFQFTHFLPHGLFLFIPTLDQLHFSFSLFNLS